MLNLLLPSFFLLTFGFFNLLGIKPDLAYTQLINIGAGSIAYLIIKKINRRFFEANSSFFYWLFLFSLILTFLIGFEVKGSKRWINLYFFNFQSSELFKVFFIVFLSSYLTKNQKNLEKAYCLLKLFIYFLLPTFLIFKQPDLGNAMVYFLIFIGLVFFSTISKKLLMTVFVIFMISLPFGWLTLKDYQKARFLSFINPQIDKAGTAYNMTQSIITIGSGGILGNGLGLGMQSKLAFLPENQTDFAFAALVEQFGFIGGLAVIVLFFIIAINLFFKIRKYYYDRSESGRYKYYYVLGFFLFFLGQVIVNIGMNLGLLPIAGIALPLISYGGSAVVTYMIGLALMP